MNTPNLTPDAHLPAILAAIDNALRNGSYMTGANLAFNMLCDRLGVDRDRLAFHPGWAATVRDAAAPAENVTAGSVVSTEGSARPRPHWTIELGAEEARRWVASEPQMTDAEKDAFRAQVEGSGHPQPATKLSSPWDEPGEHCATCRCPRLWHMSDGRCAGDFLACTCRVYRPTRPLDTPEGDTTDDH